MSSRPYDRVIKIVGTQARLVELMHPVPQSTISYWAETGRIPPRHWRSLLKAAKSNGIELTLRDIDPALADATISAAE